MLNEIINYIIGIVMILLVVFGKRIKISLELYAWKKRIDGVHAYDLEVLRRLITDLSINAFRFSMETLPYGRSKWFLVGNETFCKYEIASLEFYAFSPIRSIEELDFHEYGLLLTQNGLYISWQDIINKKKKTYNVKSVYCPFSGLWKVRNSGAKIEFYYNSGEIKKAYVYGNEMYIEQLMYGINKIIDCGYTYDLYTKYIENKIKEELNFENKDINFKILTTSLGAMGVVYADLNSHFKEELLNGIVNNPQGHGFAAEYANDIVDRVKKPLLEVKRVGQDNAKDGVDRVVGNTKIQTKYYSTAKNSVNSAFESKENGGMYRYNGMQLEVPKEQYQEAVELMSKKISEGKVPGYANPEDAKLIIREGSITWQEAKLIAKGGNLKSIKYDAADGVISTLPVAGVSFAIMYARAKWSGESTEEALIIAAESSIVTLGIGTLIYTGSQQAAKILANEIAKLTGRKIVAETIAKRVGTAITFGIILVPNVFDELSGRISKQQLLKNVAVAGGRILGGIAASAGAGMMIGSVVPGVGTTVGTVVGATSGVVGGIVGASATKKVMDKFIEDDRVEMFAQLKEEYIDVVMSIGLSNEEFDAVQNLVFDKQLGKKLKDMYGELNKHGSRIYAREKIVEKSVINVIKERETIDNNELNKVLLLD